MSATPVSVLGLSLLTLTALAYAAPVMVDLPATVSSILSLKTARFLKFSSGGNVYADGHYGTPETTLYIEFHDSRLDIMSVSGHCLIFENGTFHSQIRQPSNSNNMFELVHVGGNSVAFRVDSEQHQMSSGSGSDETNNMESDESHEEAIASDCYLGFTDVTSGPKCYDSTDSAATRFIIFELFS